jgi:hypothetical protein
VLRSLTIAMFIYVRIYIIQVSFGNRGLKSPELLIGTSPNARMIHPFYFEPAHAMDEFCF